MSDDQPLAGYRIGITSSRRADELATGGVELLLVCGRQVLAASGEGFGEHRLDLRRTQQRVGQSQLVLLRAPPGGFLGVLGGGVGTGVHVEGDHGRGQLLHTVRRR